jgi:hypothetical protein
LCLFTQDFFRGIHDADGWIGRAVSAELLGIGDEHLGIDDGLVLVAFVPSSQVSTVPISSLLLSTNCLQVKVERSILVA